MDLGPQQPIASLSSSTKGKAPPFRIPPGIRLCLKPRLPPEVIMELDALWKKDPRVPTVQSRQAWALARKVEPIKVHNWFSREKCAAERKGMLLEGTYELDPCPPTEDKSDDKENRAPKRRRLLSEGQPRSRSRSLSASSTTTIVETIPGSDFTLVNLDLEPVDKSHYSNVLSSRIDQNTTKDAYTGVSHRRSVQSSAADPHTTTERAYIHRKNELLARPDSGSSALTRSVDSVPLSHSMKSSSTTLLASHVQGITTEQANSPSIAQSLLCNQGKPERSSFTCALCKSGPTEQVASPEDIQTITMSAAVSSQLCLYTQFSLLVAKYGERDLGIRMKLVDEIAVDLSAIPWLDSMNRSAIIQDHNNMEPDSLPIAEEHLSEVAAHLHEEFTAKIKAINNELGLM